MSRPLLSLGFPAGSDMDEVIKAISAHITSGSFPVDLFLDGNMIFIKSAADLSLLLHGLVIAKCIYEREEKS